MRTLQETMKASALSEKQAYRYKDQMRLQELNYYFYTSLTALISCRQLAELLSIVENLLRHHQAVGHGGHGMGRVSFGCYIGIIWVSLRSHLGVSWVSLGCHLGVTWVSLERHLGITWVSLGYHSGITWVSLGCHLGVTSRSLPLPRWQHMAQGIRPQFFRTNRPCLKYYFLVQLLSFRAPQSSI